MAAAHMHWKICKEFGIEVKEQWYEHEPKAVTEKDSIMILWDMPIHTDRTIAANRLDIMLKSKKDKTCLLINMTAVPLDTNTTVQRLGNRGWTNVGAQNNNSPSGYGSPWYHQGGHGKLHQQNSWQYQHSWTPEKTPFYSPPSQTGPFHQVETLFAFQSPWFGLGCWERKSPAITLEYVI